MQNSAFGMLGKSQRPHIIFLIILFKIFSSDNLRQKRLFQQKYYQLVEMPTLLKAYRISHIRLRPLNRPHRQFNHILCRFAKGNVPRFKIFFQLHNSFFTVEKQHINGIKYKEHVQAYRFFLVKDEHERLIGFLGEHQSACLAPDTSAKHCFPRDHFFSAKVIDHEIPKPCITYAQIIYSSIKISSGLSFLFLPCTIMETT